jgi:hypothetical protein
MANPLHPLAKQMKQLTSKRNKTDADYELIADLEWLAGWYMEPNQVEFAISGNAIAIGDYGEIIIPGYVLDAMMVNGAKKNKLGMQFKSGVFVDGDGELIFEGKDGGLDKLMTDPNFRLQALERVNKARVLRTRPYLKQWQLRFAVHYDDTVVDRPAIEQSIEVAGRLIGLCERRPRLGRFTYAVENGKRK